MTTESGPIVPGAERVLQDGQRRPVLHAAARVQRLELGEQLKARLRQQPAEADQGRIANRGENPVAHPCRRGMSRLLKLRGLTQHQFRTFFRF